MAIGDTKTFNLRQCIVVVDDTPVTGGWGAGAALEFEPNSDEAIKTVGVGGEVTRSMTNDRSGRITITQMATGKLNSKLSDILGTMRAGLGGDIFTIYVKDLNTGDELFAEQCWIARMPNFGLQQEVDEREWLIDAGKADVSFGGNL